MKRVKLSLMASPSHRFLIKLFTFRRVSGESSKEMIEKIESSGSIRATFSSTLHDCSLDGEVRCSSGGTNEVAGYASRYGNCQLSLGRWREMTCETCGSVDPTHDYNLMRRIREQYIVLPGSLDAYLSGVGQNETVSVRNSKVLSITCPR